MTEASAGSSESGFRDRLDSWKEVATYLRRGVTTVQRWERHEGLPVHRLPHGKLGSIYALPAELDLWWAERGVSLEGGDGRLSPAVRHGARAASQERARRAGVAAFWLAVGGLAGWAVSRPVSPPHAVVEFALEFDLSETLATGDGPAVALAPDGRSLAFVVPRDGGSILHLRRLDARQSVPLPGTRGARGAFFSPDGRRLAFFAGGTLATLDLAGGPPRPLCEAPSPRGGAWGPGDRIVFAPSTNSGLMIVSASGGPPRPLTILRAEKGEESHRWPAFLPDGDSVAFAARLSRSRSYDEAVLSAVALRDGSIRELHRGGTYPVVGGAERLLFVSGGRLLGRRLGGGGSLIDGEPEPVLDDVAWSAGSGAAHVSASASGVLAWVVGGPAGARDLVRVTRDGTVRPLSVRPGPYLWPRVSPGGRSVAFVLDEDDSDVWVLDVGRGDARRLTSDGRSSFPVWRPDGRSLTFSTTRGGPTDILERPVDASSPAALLLAGSGWQRAAAWTPDARRLVYVAASPATGQDLWLLQRGAAPTPLARTPFLEGGAQLSPDGVWLAYVTDATGGAEVVLRRLDGTASTLPVSAGGGSEPVWSRDGREVFYRQGRKMIAVPFGGGRAPRLGTAHVLFEGDFASSPGPFPNYDVWPDGRFAMVRQSRPPGAGRLVVRVEGTR